MESLGEKNSNQPGRVKRWPQGGRWVLCSWLVSLSWVVRVVRVVRVSNERHQYNPRHRVWQRRLRRSIWPQALMRLTKAVVE